MRPGTAKVSWGMMAEARGYRQERWIFGLKVLKTRSRSLSLSLCVAAAPVLLLAQEIPPVSPVSQTHAGNLSVSQVVANLVASNAERSKALESYTGRRTYRLDYHGFPADLQSQMIVKVVYRAPSTKEFTIVSESGSKLLLNRVLHKLLESEEEALNGKNRQEAALNELNYDFSLIRFERTPQRSCYVLAVRPKINNKFLYRGTIWVDATDFAVRRIEAQPAKNPSFWTKRSQILQTYVKAGHFWMPSSNHTTTAVRFGGKAVLNIDYDDYDLSETHLAATAKE